MVPGLGGMQTVDVCAMCGVAAEWENQVREQLQPCRNAVQVKRFELAPVASSGDNVEVLIATCCGSRWRFDGGWESRPSGDNVFAGSRTGPPRWISVERN